ncbi:MAG: hypothetical protein ACK5L7_06920 [Paludibacteraceae bacterium]
MIKKIIFIFILFLNLTVTLKNGIITLQCGSNATGQSYSEEYDEFGLMYFDDNFTYNGGFLPEVTIVANGTDYTTGAIQGLTVDAISPIGSMYPFMDSFYSTLETTNTTDVSYSLLYSSTSGGGAPDGLAWITYDWYGGITGSGSVVSDNSGGSGGTVDFNEVYNDVFGGGSTGGTSGGGGTTTTLTQTQKNCDEISNSLANTSIKTQYDALSTKLKSGVTVEWGTEIVAQFNDLSDWMSYKNGTYSLSSPPISSTGGAHSYAPDWEDDSGNLTRMEGYMHLHPTDGTCFSPADVETFADLRSDFINLEQRSKDAMAVAVTLSTTYILKVYDWEKLRDLSESTLSALETKFIDKFTYTSDSQEKIFMDTYINDPSVKGVFQLFKTDSSGNRKSISMDSNGNITYTPC